MAAQICRGGVQQPDLPRFLPLYGVELGQVCSPAHLHRGYHPKVQVLPAEKSKREKSVGREPAYQARRYTHRCNRGRPVRPTSTQRQFVRRHSQGAMSPTKLRAPGVAMAPPAASGSVGDYGRQPDISMSNKDNAHRSGPNYLCIRWLNTTARKAALTTPDTNQRGVRNIPQLRGV